MLTDSCNCERSGHGCKGITRPHQPTWCPVCDRNKMKRRCQSEGLYQEGDPLKELNWCCDRGCDLLNRSSKFSQIKKTELDLNEKKFNYSGNADMEGGDNCYSFHRKQNTRFLKEKFDSEISSNLQKSGLSSDFDYLTKSQGICKYHDSNPEKFKQCMGHLENNKVLKCHLVGDYHDVVPSNKALELSEKDHCSTEIKDLYLKEMEILRNNLTLLKDGVACDGKRMRQRSESEPGFAELSGGVPKRARDNSPKIKINNRKLPATPLHLNSPLHPLPVRHHVTNFYNSKSISSSLIKTSNKKEVSVSDNSKDLMSAKLNKEFLLNESDEDHEGNIHCENKNDSDAAISDDDAASTASSSTSSDSNTASKVGESLKSISLNEVKNNFKSFKNFQESVETLSDFKETTQIVLNNQEQLFRNSLFPNVPPYVKFFMHDLKGPALPADIRKHLKWRLSSITPIVIRRTLINSGFKLVRSELIQGSFDRYYNLIYVPPHRNEGSTSLYPSRFRMPGKSSKESNDWTGQWGKHMKSFVFKTLKDYQKLNHFPGTFQIGRKDRLWKNLCSLMMKFGKKEFGFIPKTFILPHDRKLLRTAWEKASGVGKGQWIVKPPAAARGTGIKVVHRWGQIPKKKSLIVQKYIAQPYLINGSKFDLRLYVLMTSIHPLRIYLYDDGLVRFASVKYSEDVECLSNRFMHLTNYSINKLSNQYQVNADASSCNGHKWSLKSLWSYFEKEGVNVKTLRKNLTDLVIKTIISGESNINMMSKNNLPSRYCSYELFGIDVLLDHALKPWLLEVNISPSLHSASPLDLAVKGPLVKELLNIAGFQIPAKLTKEQEQNYLENYGIAKATHTLCYDKRLYWMNLSKEEKTKQESFQSLSRNEYLKAILEDLTPDDVRHLIQFEDELTQLNRFEKIFPTSRTHTYHQYFESPRYYNMMLDAWETKYRKNREEGIQLLSSLCLQKFHLHVPIAGGKTKLSPNQSASNIPEVQEGGMESDSKDEKDSDLEIEEDKKEISKSLPGTHYTLSRSPSAIKNLVGKQKTSKAAVISKPMGITSHLTSRRPKNSVATGKSTVFSAEKALEGKGEPQVPLKETRFNVLSEMRHNGLKFASDAKQEKLKQFSNCKLENSIISESLNSGKNVLSPTKHIHNACIKMNTSS